MVALNKKASVVLAMGPPPEDGGGEDGGEDGGEQTTTCPSGHPLQPFTTPHGSHSCDMCRKRVERGTEIQRCVECDFDACESCLPKALANRAGAAIRLVVDTYGGDAGLAKFYCGRFLGRDAIPGSDGHCGPTDGPACADCKAFECANRAGAPIKPGQSYARDKMYCGRFLGPDAIPGSDGQRPAVRGLLLAQRVPSHHRLSG